MTTQIAHTATKHKAVIHTINCYRSGIPLLQATTLCSNGWPLLSTEVLTGLCHPVYNYPLTKLILTLDKQLDDLTAYDYSPPEDSLLLSETGLTMSAIMYSLDCMYQPPYGVTPSLPSQAVIAGTAKRLLNLAGWYHHATSKRLNLPLYSVSKLNNNVDWDNFKTWCDDAFQVKKEWSLGRATSDVEAEIEARKAETEDVFASSVYVKLDFNKVWAWIELQITNDGRYHKGRVATFKSVFKTGIVAPEDWSIEDIDDVTMAVTECCDCSSDIMLFITKRLNTIRAGINDFYSSFTMLGSTRSVVSKDTTVQEALVTAEFLGGYDSKASQLTELPAAPSRADYNSLGAFLKATAEHNILAKRFALKPAPQVANSEAGAQL